MVIFSHVFLTICSYIPIFVLVNFKAWRVLSLRLLAESGLMPKSMASDFMLIFKKLR